MARKSRKIAVDAPTSIVTKIEYKTAVYARLSVEDTRNNDGNSLENQILLVQKYVENNPELTLCSVFSDNGMTGTNFNRPGFEGLMDEIRRGHINCIVVKDLSRFGRDYVEAGNFLEVIFPRLGIRFISIGDNYDSFDPRCQGEGMSIALKNMINAFYAKDISVKIRTAFAVKRQKGEFVGKIAPFGYVKSPENVNALTVDREAAKIVQMIFKLKLDGLGAYQIARQLSSQSIPTPGHYRYINGMTKEKRYEHPQFWDTTTVMNILENVACIGNLALGKSRNTDGKQHKLPKSEWTIVENTHEPIIAKADFVAVAEQLRLQKEQHKNKTKHNRDELPENLLEGLVFCKECGRAYRRIPNTHRDKTTYRLTYICLYCNQHKPKYVCEHFRHDELYEAVYAAIRSQIDIFIGQRDLFLKTSKSDTTQTYHRDLKVKVQDIHNELDRIPARKLKLYDDLYAKIINENDYRLFSERYDTRKDELSKELERLLSEISTLNPQYISSYESLSVTSKWEHQSELTREMLLAFVERIEVSHDRKLNIMFRYRDELSSLYQLNVESEEYLHG